MAHIVFLVSLIAWFALRAILQSVLNVYLHMVSLMGSVSHVSLTVTIARTIISNARNAILISMVFLIAYLAPFIALNAWTQPSAKSVGQEWTNIKVVAFRSIHLTAFKFLTPSILNLILCALFVILVTIFPIHNVYPAYPIAWSARILQLASLVLLVSFSPIPSAYLAQPTVLPAHHHMTVYDVPLDFTLTQGMHYVLNALSIAETVQLPTAAMHAHQVITSRPHLLLLSLPVLNVFRPV